MTKTHCGPTLGLPEIDRASILTELVYFDSALLNGWPYPEWKRHVKRLRAMLPDPDDKELIGKGDGPGVASLYLLLEEVDDLEKQPDAVETLARDHDGLAAGILKLSPWLQQVIRDFAPPSLPEGADSPEQSQAPEPPPAPKVQPKQKWTQPEADQQIERYKAANHYHKAVLRIEDASKKEAAGIRRVFGRNTIKIAIGCSGDLVTNSPVWQAMRNALGIEPPSRNGGKGRRDGGRKQEGLEVALDKARHAPSAGEEASKREIILRLRKYLSPAALEEERDKLERGVTTVDALELILDCCRRSKAQESADYNPVKSLES